MITTTHKINWKTIIVKLDKWYEFWPWFENYVKNWLDLKYKGWEFRSKGRWCIVWFWELKESWFEKYFIWNYK